MITRDDLDFLTSEAGSALLARLAEADLSEASTLKLITQLRKTHTLQQASAALTTARLRQQAEHKFGDDAHRMLFTDAALQQASDPLIRAYRAGAAGITDDLRVLDVGCGIGSDSIAFARAGATVRGVDIDPLRVAIARHNAAALDLNITFEVADARTLQPDDRQADVIFYDPARRDDSGRRIYNVEAYQPPLSLIQQWNAPRLIAKLSPGLDVSQVTEYGGLLEFISVEGALKEAVLHTGKAVQGSGLRATLLTANPADDERYQRYEVHHWQRNGSEPDAPLSEPRGWLVEPDPALLRANLVQDVAVAHEGALLDPTIAYFTTDHAPQSPWLRAWQILDWMPFHLKRLRAYLRERNVGVLTVKKRGSPITPQQLISQLKLSGTESRTLVLTRCENQPIVLICADINAP
jgi:protein-L-isoaspartate O-methyltransferase